MSHKFLEPIKIGNQTVKNRVMFLAMAKNISNFDDSVSAKDIAYVESVAAGGVGLLVPGAMIVDPEWPSVLPLQPGIYDDRFIPGLRRLVLAAHKTTQRSCSSFGIPAQPTIPALIRRLWTS